MSLDLAPHMLTRNTREQGRDRLMGKAKLKDCIHTWENQNIMECYHGGLVLVNDEECNPPGMQT